MADRWRFVASIASSPTVRLDLNDLAIWEVADADLTPPDLSRQASGSASVDGENISASWFGNRVVGLTLELSRTNTDLAATQRQLLERELARATNILEYRPDGATSSVFFRTFRSVSTMQREISTSPFWTFNVQILAEPFAYGLKEVLSSVTLAANPTSANGCFFDIAAANAKGDVETPLVMEGTAGNQWASHQSAIGVRRRGVPSSAPRLFQCESMTAGPDTATQANSAEYSGSGSNSSVTTFGTNNTLTNRLTATIPASGTIDARGSYRIFLRYNTSSTSSTTYSLRAVSPAGALDTITLTASGTTSSRYVDLGLITYPAGADPVYSGASGVILPVLPGTFDLQARRDSGTANLVWDHILLVPADDQLTLVNWGIGQTVSEEVWLDGFNRRAYWTTGGEINSIPGGNIYSVGGWPHITPNQDNRIHWIPQCKPGQAATLTSTYTVTPSYWPRYLDVRPAST